VRPGQRDNPLAQPAVRTAVAMCLDRQALAQATWRGLAGLARSYLPPAHPLVAPAPTELVMDRQAARQLLQQAGWVTSGEDPSAPRIAAGAAGAQAGATLEFTLSVASGGLEEVAASEIQRQLSECGIRVVLEAVPAESLSVPFPEGPVFGAGFESVLWAWPTWSLPPCELFLTSELPSQASPNGVNASGFSSAAYDRACSTLLFSGGWGTEAIQAAADTQALLAEGLPALPLFARPRLLLAAPDVCGLTSDPAIPSLLWAIESVTRGDACAGS
jgi:peptide/nickel transport system substrate-binding protein